MITIPERVKDALRDGRMLKNYKFNVLKFDYIDIRTLKNYERYTAPRSGTYSFYYSVGYIAYGIMIGSGPSAEGGYWEEDETREVIEHEYYIEAGTSILVYTSALESGADFMTLTTDDTESHEVLDFVINNNNLVKESVKFDERMCSGSEIKFGLCEGSSLEFQYFDKPNINGKRIQAFIEVQYKDENGDLAWHEIPMGFYTVSQCPMQFSTGIRKVVAYNKLKGEYLDAKANDLLIEAFDNPTETVSFIDVRNVLLSDYQIETVTPSRVPITAPYYFEQVMIPRVMKIPQVMGKTHINFYYTNPKQTLYPAVESLMSIVTLDPTKSYRLTPDFPVGQIEDAWYTTIYNSIKAANLTDMTVDDYMPYIINTTSNYGGWKLFFSVELVKNGQSEFYTNIGYEHGLSGVVGSLTDLCKKTITGYSSLIYHIAVEINLNGTNNINDTIHSANLTRDTDVYYYTFYDNPSLYEWDRIRPNPYQITLPDGEKVDYSTARYATMFTLYEITDISPADQVQFTINDMPEFTLRDVVSASYETVCQYGKLDRETDLFSGVELNTAALLPRDNLYPANNLYPGGLMDKTIKSGYSKLWTDTVGVQTFRNLYIKYKGLDENQQPAEFTLERIVNADGTTDYNMSDNWLFKNLVWTAEQVGDYADAMVAKMQGIKWFPFELWGAGLPYLETGDEIEIITQDGSYTSYILQRQLSGIQNLQDTFINGELDIF